MFQRLNRYKAHPDNECKRKQKHILCPYLPLQRTLTRISLPQRSPSKSTTHERKCGIGFWQTSTLLISCTSGFRFREASVNTHSLKRDLAGGEREQKQGQESLFLAKWSISVGHQEFVAQRKGLDWHGRIYMEKYRWFDVDLLTEVLAHLFFNSEKLPPPQKKISSHIGNSALGERLPPKRKTKTQHQISTGTNLCSKLSSNQLQLRLPFFTFLQTTSLLPSQEF